MNMNMEFFRLINNLANKNSVLDKIMIFFSKDIPYIFMAIVAIVFILGITKRIVIIEKLLLILLLLQ